MTNIVVGMDESAGAAVALRWAVREGALRKASVVALMAWSYLDQHHATPGAPFDPNYGEPEAVAALDAAVVAAVGPEAAATVERRVGLGLAPAVLLRAAAPDDLLVVGARGLGGFKELLVGSVSQHCLHHARCPVALVRPHPAATAHAAPEQAERIVVGVDGSAHAQRALAWALDEARARSAAVEVVHAWHFPYLAMAWTPVAFDPAMFEPAAHEVLARSLAAADVHGLAPIEQTVTCASPAHAILTAAKGADLVVVGARGTGGFAELVLGSVGHQVTHHAECPVVVVPSSEVLRGR